MRPLRLTMTAFGPYAGTEVVDFDALTELGLFVVAGNNGAGKTTIFDALHYCLFGTLPGRRATYIRLKSDHADAGAECVVSLDFAAHGKQWRVERSPKQTRPKRRGVGETDVDRRATLFRLDQGTNGPATAIANKIGDVDEQCRELVGLTGKQFERVALLPQGEFSRVLRESGTERRDLLRTLFSSEIFGDATSLLTEDAAAATATDRAALERIDLQQAALADSLGELVGQPVAPSKTELQCAISDFRRVQLGEMTERAHQLEANANQASQAHRAALDISERLRRRSQVEQEQVAHLQGETQHLTDVGRLDRARAAVPVASQVRAVAEQEQRHGRATERVLHLQQRVNRALAGCGADPIDAAAEPSLAALTTELTELGRRLHERRDAALRVRDMQAATNRLQGDQRRIDNEIGNLDEQMNIAQAHHRRLSTEVALLETAASIDECEQSVRTALAQLHQRTELHQLDHQRQGLGREIAECDTTITQTQVAYEQARQAQTAAPGLQQKADAAFAALQECTQRRDAARDFAQATERLATLRTDHERARSRADQLWDAFIAGTAARVAEALVDHEPCPVCGAHEHPNPATLHATDRIVTQDQVTAARADADDLQSQVDRLKHQIEALIQTHPGLASLSMTEAAAEISTAKAMALGARTLADETRQRASRADELATQLAAARTGRDDLDMQLRSVDERCNQLRGSLGDLVHESVAALQTCAERAQQDLANAQRRVASGADLLTALATAEHDIETIGLGQVAAQARRSATAAKLVERQGDLELANETLLALDDSLAAGSTAGAPDRPEQYEQRAQAARQAIEVLAELTTALALTDDAVDGVRRARSILDDRISQSPFASADDAMTAYVEPATIDLLEAQTSAFVATSERLHGQLQELSDLPADAPDTDALGVAAEQAARAFTTANRAAITAAASLDRIQTELQAVIDQRTRLEDADPSTRRLERVAALVKGDNDRNTSLENWVLAAHLRDVVELANVRLARSTHQRFQLCVLDDGETKRGKWGLDLGVEDTVTGTQRPTAGLSGGELFQASLALALGLADAVMNQTAGVRIDALFIDEGFGSLDEVSVERAIDLLDELRDRGAMVGVITHVPALLDALPLGISVVDAPSGHGSTIRQRRLAA